MISALRSFNFAAAARAVRMMLGVSVVWQMAVAVVFPRVFGYPFAIDAPAYFEAARRLVLSGSPYSAELHQGPIAHHASNIAIGYFYPPPLAQLFVPLLGWDTVAVWVLNIALMTVLLLMIRRIIRQAGEEIWWPTAIVAVLLFRPLAESLLSANASTILTVLVSIGLAFPRWSGIALVGGAFVKFLSGPLLLGELVTRPRRSTVIGSGAIVAVSIALAPHAWIDWLSVFGNSVGSAPAPYAGNFSAVRAQEVLGLPLVMPALVAAGLLMIGGVARAHKWNDARRAWWPITLAVLLVPATVWHHYWAVVLPLAFFEWSSASRARKTIMIMTAVSMGTGWVSGVGVSPTISYILIIGSIALLVGDAIVESWTPLVEWLRSRFRRRSS